MNSYGRRAMEHWARWLPARYRSIQDPEAFFQALGLEAETQILDLAEQVEGPDLPGEDTRQRRPCRSTTATTRAAAQHPAIRDRTPPADRKKGHRKWLGVGPGCDHAPRKGALR